MKLLFIAATETHYIRDNWLSTLNGLYDVIYVCPFWLRKIYNEDETAEYIRDILRNNDIKYIFIYSDGLFNRLSEDFFMELKRDYLVFTFYADDEPEKWYQRNEPFDHRYDLIFTQSYRGHLRRKEQTPKNFVSQYLPWGYNPRMFYKIEGSEKKCDVMYIGTNKICDDGTYFEDGKSRRNLVCSVYKYCKKAGYKFELYGSKWNEDSVLKQCWCGYVEDEKLSEVINNTKIVLNFGMAFEGGISKYQTKLRHYEIGGCGVYQITNTNPELSDIFGDDIGYFDTEDELISLLDIHLANDSLREEKADRVYRACVEKHTIEHRIRTMISYADEMCKIDGDIDGPKSSDVEIIEISGLDELEQLCKNAGHKIISNKKYCLIKDRNDLDFRFNESVVRHFMDEGYDVITINTILRYWGNKKEKFIEARRSSDAPNGQTLSVQNDERHTKNIDLMKRKFTGVCTEDVWCPIMNLLIKTKSLSQVLENYINGNLFVDTKYSICRTAMYTNIIDLFFDEMIPTDLQDEKIALLLKRADSGKKVAIYGFGGYLYAKIFTALYNRGSMDNVFLIDRGLQGKTAQLKYNGNMIEARVYGYNDIKKGNIEPDVIAIASMFSYKQILKNLNKYETKTLLLPLADLRDIRWLYL